MFDLRRAKGGFLCTLCFFFSFRPLRPDALPLAMSIRVQADAGQPTVVADPDGEVAALYKALARQVAVKIATQAKDYSAKFPNISISKST